MSPLASDDVSEKHAQRVGRTPSTISLADTTGARDDATLPDDEAADRAVVAFLEDFDGWVWRANVKVEFGWSTSKTNEVLARLEGTDTIVRHRDHGIEIIALPGRAPGWFAAQT